MYEERNLDIILSNPIKTRAIASAKIKTDKFDAVKTSQFTEGDSYQNVMYLIKKLCNYVSW